MTNVDVKQAQAQLPLLLEAVLKGEEIVITRDDQPVARLLTVNNWHTVAREGSDGALIFDCAKDVVTIRDDFDEPLEELREYLQ